MGPSDEPSTSRDEPVPLFGSWRRWYVVVLATLAGLIALFWLLTLRYR